MHSDTEISYSTYFSIDQKYSELWLNTFDLNTLQETKVGEVEYCSGDNPYLTDGMKYLISYYRIVLRIRFRETKVESPIFWKDSSYKLACIDNKLAIWYKDRDGDKHCQLYLIESGKTIWKKRLEFKFEQLLSLCFADSSGNTIVASWINIDQNITISYIDWDHTNNHTVKSYGNFILYEEFMSYQWSEREVWVQDMFNNIKAFYFDTDIWGIEECIHEDSKSDTLNMRITFEYPSHYQFGKILIITP